ncbi:MAG: thioredoxin [Bacilli bacterium]|nr:thioredoxin [Bacilli bacterium]
MQVIEVNNNNFLEEVINSEKIVLADFNAEWCGPCKMLKPIIDEIANENDNVKIVSINVDEEDELSEKYDISSIPCLVVFKDGKEINRSIGLKSKDEILGMLGGN